MNNNTPDTEGEAYGRGYKQGRFDSEMDRLNEGPATPETNYCDSMTPEEREAQSKIKVTYTTSNTPDTEKKHQKHCRASLGFVCSCLPDVIDFTVKTEEFTPTTPDTEWEEEFWNERIDEAETLAELFSGGDMYNLEFARSVINPKIQALLTSRDTFWKERVKPLRRIIRRMDRELKDYEAIALYDIYAMAFYDDTGVWPPGKSAPIEMHHEFDQAERSKKYTEWHQALDTLLDNLK